MTISADPPLIKNRYQTMEMLGHGGMSKVFRGWDVELERTVAIKRLRLDVDENFIEEKMGWREARTMASLQHPNIVTLFDYGVDGEGAFFVMEMLSGENLEDITRDNPLNPDDFFAVAQQALAGISAAHQTGILHRDIKPSNFMIHRDASGHVTVKILDFGLAKFQQEPSLQTVSQDSSILGSIHYLSPEQIHLRPVDFRTDLYALGLVFYYTLVGRPAFNGTVADLIVQHLQHDPAPLEALRPDLPPALCEWLRKMYAKAPESRPATAAAALNELAAIIRNPWVTHYVPDPAQAVEPVRMVPPPVEEIPARAMEHRAAFRAVFWTATIVAGVLILCGVLWWMGKSRSPVAAVPPATPPSVASVPVVASAPAPTVTTAPVGTTVLSPTDLGALKSVFESGGDAVVEGVPVVTGENKAGTILYLNFSRDYTDSLSLVFFKEKDPAFTEDTLRQYIGRRIRVQGPVSEYNGKLQMKIQSLKQIQTP